ncbi:MAG: DsbA family protein [Pseudomonadota bacterium]|nr:DsbA family protein [Pseudomonadota bacterium]
MRPDRRQFLLAAALGAAAFAAVAPQDARAQANVTELMAPGMLPERALGDPKAPVTIVEYASMTCSHCATFHVNTYPAMRERYITPGRVRYVLREFPLDPLAAAAFMLARCSAGDQMVIKRDVAKPEEEGQTPGTTAPVADPKTATPMMPQNEAQANERYFALVDVLFRQQRSWAYSNDPATALLDIAKQAGFTQQNFEACLSDQALLDALNDVKERGQQKFDVRSTPTFFINGKVQRGSMTIEELDKALQPLLKR